MCFFLSAFHISEYSDGILDHCLPCTGFSVGGKGKIREQRAVLAVAIWSYSLRSVRSSLHQWFAACLRPSRYGPLPAPRGSLKRSEADVYRSVLDFCRFRIPCDGHGANEVEQREPVPSLGTAPLGK